MDSNDNRRGFVKNMGAAAAGLMIVKPESVRGSQANSAMSLGLIGCGNRGMYVSGIFAKNEFARVAAICDIYDDKIEAAQKKYSGAQVFKDHKELLNSGVDAVLIATPAYLHPEHFEAAVEANKHIYCEKPAGADVAGVKRLMRAGERADPSKSIQFGFQQRYSREYLTAEKLLRTGKLGVMKMMTSFWILGNEPPTGFKSPYPVKDRKIRHWGRWMELSGGAIVEQDCHGVDTLNWFAEAHPEKALGQGGLRYPVHYGDWTSDHHNICYTYPKGIQGWLLSIKFTAGYRDVREQFYGSKGMVETARTYYKWHGPIKTSPLKNADDLRDRSLIERGDSKREITIDAVEFFYTSIIDGTPHNMARDAAESTLTSILGRMAYEFKREVTWAEMMRLG